jgi:hypothetical protein
MFCSAFAQCGGIDYTTARQIDDARRDDLAVRRLAIDTESFTSRLKSARHSVNCFRLECGRVVEVSTYRHCWLQPCAANYLGTHLTAEGMFFLRYLTYAIAITETNLER